MSKINPIVIIDSDSDSASEISSRPLPASVTLVASDSALAVDSVLAADSVLASKSDSVSGLESRARVSLLQPVSSDATSNVWRSAV